MRKFLTMLGVLLLFSYWALAQTHQLTGRVLDDQGQPVPFATVIIKSTKQGVNADADGNYSIKVKAGDVLVISGTGISSKEFPVGSGVSMNLVVPRKNNNLTEVVVTALGQTQSKARVGYSTQTFNTAAINKNGATGALDGLEGKVAGADISNIGGPGSSTKVVLRGFGVVAGGNNQPLYVVDGVPLSDQNYIGGAAVSGGALSGNGATTGGITGTDGADYGNGMNNVNPNDIESITILKGTAASSLYGGLAKNGAIMITTKKGRPGKLKIEYNGSANFSKVGKLPDYETEFGQGWGGVFVADENGSWGPRLDGKMRLWGSVVDNSQLIKPFSAIKNPLRQFYVTGQEFNNTLALSGGSETNRFYFSYGNVTSDGVVPMNANTQQRNSFSLRTNSTFGKFTFNTSINYINQALKVPNTGQGTSNGGGVFESILQIPVDLPIKAFRDINNKFFNTNNYFTPYAENPYFGLIENGNQQKLDRVFGNLDFGYKFTNDFSAEFRLGGDFTDARTFEWKNSAYAQPGSWDGPNASNPEGQSRASDYGSVSKGADNYSLVNGDFILKYGKDLGNNFTLDALAGANYYSSTQTTVATTITNLVVPGFYNLSNTSKPATTYNYDFDRKRIGVYGQVTLGYLDQLFLTGNVRNDWSSTLPIGANSIFYPGANLSWVASQLIKSDFLSYLQFRAAYGRTGSDPGPYQVLAKLGTGNISLPFGNLTVPFNGVSGYGVNDVIGNPNLKPIFTDEQEVGANARFFRDRLGLDVSLYNKKTKGQIFAVPIAPSTGYTNLVQNLGTVQNKGIELTLNVTPVQTNDFKWSFNYVFSRDWNKVLSLTGASQDPLLVGFASAIDAEMRAVVGKTVASIYSGTPQLSPSGQVVVSAGTGLPVANTSVLDPKLGITKGYYGTALYTYQMGFSNTFTYKDFTLNFSLDFRYGGVMFSSTANLILFTGNSVTTTFNDRKPFIYPNSVVANTDVSGQTTYTPSHTYVGASGASQSDLYYNTYSESNSYSGAADAQRIIDRSFLKLRDINLSYNLPKSWATKVRAGSASLGVYGRNFLLWTPKGNVYVDPEATQGGNDLLGEYGEFTGTPLTKTYGVKLNVVF
ncbi:MAG: SusC/RagA family TonB-linked outer membrane protein [Puia sp.]|nr:SusC/RagA family TonB-linked outer membrane protein [Puia sp.]